MFLAAVGIGYVVLHLTRVPGYAGPRWLLVWWIVTVYISAVAAQFFAYAFDLHTTLFPPRGVSATRYYLDPLYGPKTLYGAVVVLPATAVLLAIPWSRERYTAVLARWTPAMMATLATTRIGCFLQGCCYGRQQDLFGIVFPKGSPVYWGQVESHLIHVDSQPLPTVPTQLLEASVLWALALWAFFAVKQRTAHVFANGVAFYSAARVVLEFVRDDPDRNAFGALSTSQWIAAAVLVIYVVWRRTGTPSKAPQLSLFPR